MSKKHYNSQRKGRLYIASPTLESLMFSCYNVKDAASVSGIEYSNFVKACKLRQDIRISTYQRCASGLGMDVLIIHLPCGYIDSIASSKPILKNQHHIIEPKDLAMVLISFLQDNNSAASSCLASFWNLLAEEEDNNLMKRFLSSVIEICQDMLEENGKS